MFFISKVIFLVQENKYTGSSDLFCGAERGEQCAPGAGTKGLRVYGECKSHHKTTMRQTVLVMD